MNIRNTFFILILPFLFSACLKTYPDYYKLKYFQSTKTTNLKAHTNRLVDGLSSEISSILPRMNQSIYVIDFVNLENLKTTSQLGFLLSSEVKTHIIQKFHIPIKELEYTKYIKIGKNGTKNLSRDIDDINTKEIKKTFAFVGTYSITQRQLILYLKLINMKTGNILGMSSHYMSLTDEIIKLENQENKPVLKPHVVL